MPTVLVKYDVDDVSVATGATPPDDATPIDSPQDCFLVTNARDVFGTGSHCFTLLTQDAFAPLWICLELQDGDDKTITFRRAVHAGAVSP